MEYQRTDLDRLETSPLVMPASASGGGLSSSGGSGSGGAIPPPYRDVDDVIGSIELNRYHYWLLLLCGMGFCVDAMEVVALSFINPCAGEEWSLDNSQIALITSVVFAGQVLGSFFWGPFADAYGRWKAYMYSVLILCVSSWASGFAPSYAWLLVLRFIVGIGVGGNTVPFDIFAEFLPHTVRGRNLTYTNMFWTLGELYVTFTAYVFIGSYGWRGLVFATAVPVTVGAVLSYYILPESPRWLITQGRYAEAEEIVRDCAKHSRIQPGSFTFEDPRSRKERLSSYKEILFGAKLRGTTLKVGTIWICFGFAYYGIVLLITRLYQKEEGAGADSSQYPSSSGSDGTDENGNAVCAFDYGGIALNTSAEIGGFVLALTTIDYMGRRGTQLWTYLASGAALVVMGSLRHESASTIAILGYVTRMTSMAASQTGWVMTPELFPTRVRATAHSLVNCLARLGALASPFLVVSKIDTLTVAFFLGLVNVLAAVAAWSLPETAGEGMDKEGNDGNAKNAAIGGGGTTSSPITQGEAIQAIPVRKSLL
eukprot:GSChrysophyteH2.ASY1.ANO1.1004.1 assembled CDS